MYLDVVKPAESSSAEIGYSNKSIQVFDKWVDWEPSQISHHRKTCCDMAREWITATDYAELNGASLLVGPRWLRERFNWGASSFPIYWCEAVRKSTLDCGALAALADWVFKSRGVQSYRVQMVQRFSDVSTFQWANSWNNGNSPLCWTHNDLIYHEGCAIEVRDQVIKVWDSSAGWWIDPSSKDGYGSHLALRITGNDIPASNSFKWGNNNIRPYVWERLS
ncbi:MAG: hypothetical protein ABR530_06820 [Pyrinomonadaceae bacterium]